MFVFELSLASSMRAMAVPLAAAPFTSLAADGWQATVASPSDLSMTAVQTDRAGYDTSGSTKTWRETLKLTKRVRQPYPNQASFTTNNVALSDYLYSTDVLSGATNNSAETSPKPNARWVMPSRLLVTNNLIHWEIVAFHRDARNYGSGGVGQQVACVQVRATDGTNYTSWQTVSDTTISTYVEDANPLEVFQGDLDITSLSAGQIKLEAKVYPWLGGAASVLSSEDQTAVREFSPRYFRKGSTDNYVYVASTGNDTTGVCSSTAATAAASPCLTVGGALEKARTTLGSGTQGALDGLRIRIVNGVSFGNPNSALFPFQQDIAGVIVERAPTTARASAIVTFGAGPRPGFTNHSGPVNEGSLIFYDVSVVNGGAFSPTGEAVKLHVQFWNCNINFGGFTTTFRNSSHLSYFGVVVSNLPVNATQFIYNSSGQIRDFRGVTADLNGGAWEGWTNVGCSLTRPSAAAFEDATKGWVCYNNKLLNPQASTLLNWAGSVSGSTLGPVAIVGNLVEKVNTTNMAALQLSADTAFGNISTAVIHHNTIAGNGIYGRSNGPYDEHATVARTHKLISWKGNIGPSYNIKGDDYSTILNGTRIGNFPAEHGVGFDGNFYESADAAGGNDTFRQAYPGLNSTINGGSALFTDNKAMTAGPVAGAGGGTYTLQAGSPARNKLPTPVLKYDLAGTLRGTSAQHAGCYA